MKAIKFFSPAALALSAAMLASCGNAPDPVSTAAASEDKVITAKVKTALVKDPDLSASEIRVQTLKGVVQLSGYVSESTDIPKATQVAAEIPGVASVRNDIVLR